MRPALDFAHAYRGHRDDPRCLSSYQGCSSAALAYAAGVERFTIPDKVKASWCVSKAEAKRLKQAEQGASIAECQAKRARRAGGQA